MQARLDRGPHGIPRGSSLAGQPQDSGSLEAQLLDRPRPQTRPGSTHLLAMLQERHRLAGGFAAYPSAFVPSDPCRNTGPRRVDHLHHHTPMTVSKSPHNPGSQHSDHRTLCRAPDHTHAERQKPDGSPPSQRADHTDHNDQATQSSSKQGQTPPRSLTTAGVEDRSSSRTSTPTPHPPPPINTHSPTLNPEEPA